MTGSIIFESTQEISARHRAEFYREHLPRYKFKITRRTHSTNKELKHLGPEFQKGRDVKYKMWAVWINATLTKPLLNRLSDLETLYNTGKMPAKRKRG